MIRSFKNRLVCDLNLSDGRIRYEVKKDEVTLEEWESWQKKFRAASAAAFSVLFPDVKAPTTGTRQAKHSLTAK